MRTSVLCFTFKGVFFFFYFRMLTCAKMAVIVFFNAGRSERCKKHFLSSSFLMYVYKNLDNCSHLVLETNNSMLVSHKTSEKLSDSIQTFMSNILVANSFVRYLSTKGKR